LTKKYVIFYGKKQGKCIQKLLTMNQFDCVIVGGGHNGLVAACYLAKAGKSVVVLEANEKVGGATASVEAFPGVPAKLSRYSYLISLLPEKIRNDLGIELTTIKRTVSSYTPHPTNPSSGLMVPVGRPEDFENNMKLFTGSDKEVVAWKNFYGRLSDMAKKVFPTMTEPLMSKTDMQNLIGNDELWKDIFETPLGNLIEKTFENDVVRGIVLTDALIGTFADAHDESLLQNKCFLYHVIGNGTGDWDVPVGGMGAFVDSLVKRARELGVQIIEDSRVTSILPQPDCSKVYTNHSQEFVGQYVLVNCSPLILKDLISEPVTYSKIYLEGENKYPDKVENDVSIFTYPLSNPLPGNRVKDMKAALENLLRQHSFEGIEHWVKEDTNVTSVQWLYKHGSSDMPVIVIEYLNLNDVSTGSFMPPSTICYEGHEYEVVCRQGQYSSLLNARTSPPNLTPLQTGGSQIKVNMLLKRLPKLKDTRVNPLDAFSGTFHINESYRQLSFAYLSAYQGRLPSPIPAEIYCHSLADPTILGQELIDAGAQTLTLFALYTPHILFEGSNDEMRKVAFDMIIDSLNSVLDEPIQNLFWEDKNGQPCIEISTTVDIAKALNIPTGNIFHTPLEWPFAESPEEVGTWGVETNYDRIVLCGSGARRGGGVSGIAGHNAAQCVLQKMNS
jgi:phytoene dehydrogenase-like protein